LYDMHGNVWEWCSDWYDAGYYRTGTSTDPRGPDRGDEHVLRGGSWSNHGERCRSAARGRDRSGTSWGKAYGFRVVLVLGGS
jgi:formylglycine-generating enzyme required for sulfatase activity